MLVIRSIFSSASRYDMPPQSELRHADNAHKLEGALLLISNILDALRNEYNWPLPKILTSHSCSTWFRMVPVEVWVLQMGEARKWVVSFFQRSPSRLRPCFLFKLSPNGGTLKKSIRDLPA